MTEENKTHYWEQSNTVALIWLIFSIVWLFLTISVIFSRIWIPLLVLWFILWIIGLFSKPRGKARAAIIIPLIVFLAIAACVCYLWKSIKAPANNFANWANEQLEDIDEDSFDEDKFENIVNNEFNWLIESLSQEELNQLYEASTWDNALEKRSYVFFNILQQGMENALTTYKSKLPTEEITDSQEAIVEENTTNEEEISNNNEEETIDNNEEQTPIVEENTTEDQNPTENVQIFTESEQNDIEQIINILE